MYLTKKPSLLVSANKSDFSPYFDIIEKKINTLNYVKN